jgi:hypothetical protein
MEDPAQTVIRLLEELEQLEEEQRELDLRDDAAMRACQRKIASLRQRIQQLRQRSGHS